MKHNTNDGSNVVYFWSGEARHNSRNEIPEVLPAFRKETSKFAFFSLTDQTVLHLSQSSRMLMAFFNI